MQIDLFTFLAQIVNFLILLLVLRVFLYKPVINAMHEREQKISRRLSEAEKKQEKAENEAQEYQQKRKQLDNEYDEMMEQAKQKADQRHKELLEDAREEVTEKKHQWYDSVQKERQRFLSELQRRAENEFVSAMSKALEDLADRELETHIVDHFIRRVTRNQNDLGAAIADSNDVIIRIESTFALSNDTRERLRDVLSGEVSEEVDLTFEENPDLVCGIAIYAGDYRISWNVRKYLNAIEEELKKEFDDFDADGEREQMEGASLA